MIRLIKKKIRGYEELVYVFSSMILVFTIINIIKTIFRQTMYSDSYYFTVRYVEAHNLFWWFFLITIALIGLISSHKIVFPK